MRVIVELNVIEFKFYIVITAYENISVMNYEFMMSSSVILVFTNI